MRKFHYLYKITNNINGKYYIGRHSTDNLDDSYYGSGVGILNSITKYGKENFSKEILHQCETTEELWELEKKLSMLML
jgi:predicted transcriptional regulator